MPSIRVILLAVASLVSVLVIIGILFDVFPEEVNILLLAGAIPLWIAYLNASIHHTVAREIRDSQAADTERIVDEIALRFDEVDLVGRMMDRFDEREERDHGRHRDGRTDTGGLHEDEDRV